MIQAQDEEFSYRAYVTETLRVISAGKQFREELDSWSNLVRLKPQDNRPPDEIALDIIQRAGLTLA